MTSKGLNQENTGICKGEHPKLKPLAYLIVHVLCIKVAQITGKFKDQELNLKEKEKSPFIVMITVPVNLPASHTSPAALNSAVWPCA